MAHSVTHTRDSEHRDILSITAFCSVLLHAVIILGISFKMPDIAARDNTDNTLDVVLLNSSNKKARDEADLVSSENNLGGGDGEQDAESPIPWKAVNPQPIQSVEKTAKQRNRTSITPDQYLTSADSNVTIQRTNPEKTQLKINGEKDGKDKLTTNARQLERERLIAKMSQEWKAYQKRPKKEFLGPNTKEHGAAEYLDEWKKRVVTVGNANYPIQIKARKLSGTLIVSIEINKNGTIHDLKIISPSPHKLLNDSALRILRDASPYKAFPDEEFFRKTDILVITRAVHFLPDNRFDSTAGKHRS